MRKSTPSVTTAAQAAATISRAFRESTRRGRAARVGLACTFALAAYTCPIPHVLR